MLFNSLDFLIFFPIVLLIYYVIPRKIRYIWLLVASYFFYMCWNAKYAILLAFSTIATYICGLLLQHIKNKKNNEKSKKIKMNICVIICFTINLAILFFFKYSNFIFANLQKVFNLMHIRLNAPVFDIVLPVGISFYTFQALGYTVDVYRGDIYAEKNILKYALFVSFFPQLVAGPIERSKNLLKQLSKPQKFDLDMARDGLLLMIWGFFLKLVLADRIAIFVNTVYGDINTYGGLYLVIATILFAVQIYCDFGGYSTIAMGAAKILGIDLMENFNAPYLARSVSEFWHRWHISLSTWFRDYLYIPLGGNRKGKIRQYINLMIVFLTSGLWHGAQWSFVIWGGLNGLLQIIGSLSKSLRNKLVNILHLHKETIGHKIMQVLITFVLIDFTWIFFRANNMHDSIKIIKSIFTIHNPWILLDGSLYKCGLDASNFQLMIVSIFVLLFADVCKYKGIKIREVISRQDYWIRCLILVFSIVFIVVFGVWGAGYDASQFIYFQF